MEFTFAGHHIRLVLKDLPGEHKQALNNWILDPQMAAVNPKGHQPGLAELHTIMSGVKRLTVDGEDIEFTGRKNPLPLILDNERRITFFDYVLGLIVERNQWLLWESKYRPVFQPYLDIIKNLEEDEEDEGEPASALSMQNPT